MTADMNSHLSNRDLRIRLIAATLTLVISFVVLLIKFYAFHKTQSQAIYSDALESIVNVVTAIVGIVVIYFASQPADEEHPYGHGKAEYFSAAFEGGLIAFAAILIVVEAVKAQLQNHTLNHLETGIVLVAIAGVINLAVGLSLRFFGGVTKSLTIESAGVHLLTDFGTTAGAFVGIGLVKLTGHTWVDRATAVLLAVWMAYAGSRLVRQSFSGLLDAEDVKILERLAELFQKYSGKGIIQIHHTKIIRSGWFHHIDAHVVVPEFWSVNQAHTRLEEFEGAVINEYEYSGEANFHLDPCLRKYCSVCDFDNCPVREQAFVKRMPVVLEQLRSKEEPI